MKLLYYNKRHVKKESQVGFKTSFGFATLLYFSACVLLIIFFPKSGNAQTPTDGLMMPSGKICVMSVYNHDTWTNYWEGGLKRENFNIGKVTAQSVGFMTAIGISKHINIW